MSRGGGWARAVVAVAVVVGADQLTKALAKGAIERGDGVDVLPGLELTNTRNRGIAFGALQDQGLVVGALIGAALLALVVYFALHAARAWLWLPVGMLLGGAAGNLIDRAREGAVVDFIDPVLWPAFNVADACIVVGVLALAYIAEGPPSRP